MNREKVNRSHHGIPHRPKLAVTILVGMLPISQMVADTLFRAVVDVIFKLWKLVIFAPTVRKSCTQNFIRYSTIVFRFRQSYVFSTPFNSGSLRAPFDRLRDNSLVSGTVTWDYSYTFSNYP